MTRHRTLTPLPIASAILLCHCVPEVGPPASLLLAPRVLAVRSEPAEVAPGAVARLVLFAAGPGDGRAEGIDDALADAEWALCLAPKPPVDNNFISELCLRDDAAVSRLGVRGAQAELRVPDGACALFGPQTPPQPSGEPPARPREPDATGGYYQPVRVRVPALGLTALAGVRILCGLPSAEPAVAAAYRAQYVANRNPEIASLYALYQGAPWPLDALPVGAAISLRLVPRPESAESFVVFDPMLQLLRPQRESLRVSWFAGQGRFARATTDDAQGAEIAGDFTAPEAAGPVLLWAVLRDSRGGVAVIAQPAQVR